MRYIEGIFQGAPLWVWPLLLALIILGLLSTRTRSVQRAAFFTFPLMVLITINSIASLPNPWVVWPAFVLGYGIGAYVAYGLQSRWILGRDGNRLMISGEWFTMAALMTIFFSNFVAGAVEAMVPQAYQSAEFMVPFAFIIAAASGSFLGRSVRALKYQGPAVI
ncbi:MAG: hypothetical protein ACU0A2_02530 [Cognatishimia sp.]|uniref:hypothetical protein n=1 Tax=Cognatishimia sp. TaxID=2211648 RepID=UPI004058961C